MTGKNAILYPALGGILNGGPADDAVLRAIGALMRRGAAGAASVLAMVRRGDEGPHATPEAIRARLLELAGARAEKAIDVNRHGREDLDLALRTARDSGWDLLVTGRRLPSSHLARNPFHQRLARKAPCSLLLANPWAEPSFERVLVAVDFSTPGADAVRAALAFADLAGPRRKVTCYHAFDLPYGATYAERSRARYVEKRRVATGEEFERFVAEHDLPAGRLTFIASAAEQVGTAVTEMALALRADLVVAGSRGRTVAASVLFGSTAEDLVASCSATLLIVKRKGETVGLLKALLEA